MNFFYSSILRQESAHMCNYCAPKCLHVANEICSMVHRGEILLKAIRQSGIPITRIVKSMNKSRRWLYNMFEKSDVPLDTLFEIEKIISYDFSSEIPELKNKIKEKRMSLREDEEDIFGNNSAEYWKNKYLKLLEEYSELLKKLK